MNLRTHPIASGSKKVAFTLIELLVVISIIGILAAMIANLSGSASDQRKRKLVEAQKEKLVTAIENYKTKMGFYPPDNITNVDNAGSAPVSIGRYQQSTAMSALFYELTGPTVDIRAGTTNYQLLNGTSVLPDDLTTAFGRQGVANSAPTNSPDQQAVNYLIPTPNPNEYKAYPGLPIPRAVYGLVVPVSLDNNPVDISQPMPANYINFWHYDSSSTNRHNQDSFDVWAVFSSGKNIVTNCNWIQQ